MQEAWSRRRYSGAVQGEPLGAGGAVQEALQRRGAGGAVQVVLQRRSAGGAVQVENSLLAQQGVGEIIK